MFEWIKTRLTLLAIDRGLKRRAPERFLFSQKANYYVQHLESEDQNEKVLIDGREEDSVFGRLWDGDRFEAPIAIENSELLDWRLVATRFYGFHRLDTLGLYDFWRNELFLRPVWVFLIERFQQRFFNWRFKFRNDRISVLQRLVDEEIREASRDAGLLHERRAKSIVELQTLFFGNRVFGHPKYEAIGANFSLVIQSLAESGDVVETKKHEYLLSAKALVTLSDHEAEERRHRESVKQNRRLVYLTVVIAIATAVQASSVFVASN